MPSVYFITGVSSGFGHALALRAVAAGHTVVGTVRSRARSAEAVSTLEGKGIVVTELNVTNSSACTDVINNVAKRYGSIDVLINNAGYSILGAMESFSDEEAQQQMETNFYGPFRLIRTALPHMRANGSGTIVNITSIAGLDALPSCSLYSASKFALEGLSESLAREVTPLGIRVLLVEPGAFRTQFATAVVQPKNPMGDIYPAVKGVLDKFAVIHGTEIGDPSKGAARIVEAIDGVGMGGDLKGKVLRIPLGSDCITRWEKKIESEKADLATGRAVGYSTDFN